MGYTARGEVTQITQQQQAPTRLVTPKRIDCNSNLAGERTSITRAADLAGTQIVATTTVQYDPAGRLTEWKHVQSSTGAKINRYTWTYGPLGGPVGHTSVDGTSTLQYDQSRQVTAATHTGQVDENYEYDSNGNRTNTGTSTGANNRLLADDKYDYQYDAEGNRTRRTDRATGQYQILA